MLIAWLVLAATLSRSIRASTTISIPITTQDIIAGDVFFEILSPSELEYTYRLRPAKDFGSAFSERLEGVPLVITDPPGACQEIRNARDLNGGVALIDRG